MAKSLDEIIPIIMANVNKGDEEAFARHMCGLIFDYSVIDLLIKKEIITRAEILAQISKVHELLPAPFHRDDVKSKLNHAVALLKGDEKPETQA